METDRNGSVTATASADQPSNPRPRSGRINARRWLVGIILLGAAAIFAAFIIAGRPTNDTSGPPPDGPSAVPAERSDVVAIPAGAPIQPIVDSHPAGTTFSLTAGTFREQQVTPRDGDVFEGAGPGTVMNGARILEGWTADGDGWSVGGQTQEAVAHGDCRSASPRCDRAEELFVDGQRLTHVASLAEVTGSSWWFDYEADTIHIGLDPAGRLLETSTTAFAFKGEATGVTIRDLTVTHHATPAQSGAIHAAGPDWVIEGVTAVDNHALGIFFSGDRTIVRDSLSRGNGQMGMGGSGAHDALVERVELADNNQIGFNDEWEAGGAKFTLTTGMKFLDSDAHGNDGAGIWFDESAQDTVISGNRAADNSGAGIFYEISEDARITGNTVTGNGWGEETRGWLWGAGIQVAASGGIEITGNDVSGNLNGVVLIQQDRGDGPLGDRQVDDITVEGNRIVAGSGLIGAASDDGDDLFDRSIEFRDNSYEVSDDDLAFAWDGKRIDRQAWEQLGFS